MPNTRLYETEKLLQNALLDPNIDPKSRARAIAGLADITVAKIKLRHLRERQRAKEAAEKSQRKSFSALD